MSRIRTASDFRLELRKIHDNYERIFRPVIAQVRSAYAQNPLEQLPPLIDESLQAHIRAYVVNAFLAALNWRLDAPPETDLPNLIPEAPLESLEKGTIRFLDYLGLERHTTQPLLVVETKRPSALLPRLAKLSGDFVLSLPEVVSRGLAGDPLVAQWSQWLSTLRDYIRSIHARANQAPKRVLLTNGDWLILFLDPSDAFLEGGTSDAERILVLSNRSEIEHRYAELFRALEHATVIGEAPGLTPGDLPFYIASEDVDRLMHGLRLRYIEQRRVYQLSPVISVAPVIFLRSRYGPWLRVETPPEDYELPHRHSQLGMHLNQVHKAAMNLLRRVNAALGTDLRAFPLSRHYQEEEFFDPIRGVIEHGRDEFFVVTGDKTHYLLPKPSVPQCPHHDWAQSHDAGSASPLGPIMRRSITPRSFFTSQEEHHCAHRDVATAKASQITAQNRERCGLRSGEEGDAFCEIWRFEVHLCCRTCAFENVCTKAQVFRLPCQQSKNVPAPRAREPRRITLQQNTPKSSSS